MHTQGIFDETEKHTVPGYRAAAKSSPTSFKVEEEFVKKHQLVFRLKLCKQFGRKVQETFTAVLSANWSPYLFKKLYSQAFQLKPGNYLFLFRLTPF